VNELALALAAALEKGAGSSMPGVILYDPEVGPGDVGPAGHGPVVYLPEMDELPGADSNGE